MSRTVAGFLLALLVAACATGSDIRRNESGGNELPETPGAHETGRVSAPPIEPSKEYRGAIERGSRTAAGRPGPGYWQQWADYTLSARVFPETRRLEGRGRIVYHNRSPDALDRIHLGLYQNLHAPGAPRLRPVEVTGGVELGRVRLNGRALPSLEIDPSEAGDGAPTGYVVDGTLLTLVPPDPLPAGARATIELDWGFRVPQAGAGARMGTGEDLLFLAYWYPIVRVYDDVEGWDLDPFLGQAEFYAGFGSYDLTIEAPAEWLVVSTGQIVNGGDVLSDSVQARLHAAARTDSVVRIVTPENFGRLATARDAGETLSWRFMADSVHDVAFSATRASNWDAARAPVGDIDGDGSTEYTLVNALYRESAPRWSEVARYARHAITFLSEFTGVPYPWPHVTAVEGGGIITGGMEFPMMTLIGDYNVRGDSALYYVTAHELGHMWIPMIVSSNERRYAWMDEGMTTFAENMARMEFFPGPDHHEPDRQDYIETAREGGEGPMMQWSDYQIPGAYGVASYDKPASVLVALRGVLGEPTFHRAYRAFFDRWAYRLPYPWDFFATVEDVAGRDLDWFWRTWFYETATLDQAVGEVAVQGGRTRITIESRGDAPMPAPVSVTCEDGGTVERTVPVDTWLEGRKAETIAVDCAATRVEIDSARAWPDVDRSNNAWSDEPAARSNP